MPDQNFKYKPVDAKGKALKHIPYKELGLDQPWKSFDLAHELTTRGIQKFVADYPEHTETIGVAGPQLVITIVVATTN